MFFHPLSLFFLFIFFSLNFFMLVLRAFYLVAFQSNSVLCCCLMQCNFPVFPTKKDAESCHGFLISIDTGTYSFSWIVYSISAYVCFSFILGYLIRSAVLFYRLDESETSSADSLFERLCPLLILRLLPLRVFTNCSSSIMYGQHPNQGILHGRLIYLFKISLSLAIYV